MRVGRFIAAAATHTEWYRWRRRQSEEIQPRRLHKIKLKLRYIPAVINKAPEWSSEERRNSSHAITFICHGY